MINNIFNIEYGNLVKKKVSKYVYIKGTRYKIELVDKLYCPVIPDIKKRVILFDKKLNMEEFSIYANSVLVYIYAYELGLTYYQDKNFLHNLIKINCELPFKSNQIIEIIKSNKGNE